MRRTLIALAALATGVVGVFVTAQAAEANPCLFQECTKVPRQSIHCGGILYSTCTIIRPKVRPVLYR